MAAIVVEQREPGSLRRDIGRWSLLFTGLSSMIGSGWLFGAMQAAGLAGPGAVVAWLIGSVFALLLAVIASELGTTFQISGGLVRYPQATHGALVGFVSAWANWISIVSVIPLEAEASIQYLSSWPAPWARGLFAHGILTPLGLSLASVLLIIYFLLNYWGVKFFARANSGIAIFKLIIPGLTSVMLILASRESGNFARVAAMPTFPYGLSGVLTAVATSGIVLSFNGFQSPLNLAGESRNPARDIPFALIGSVVLGAITYVLLQFAYVVVITPAHLAQGWAHVNFSSPFAQLAMALNLNWLALMLYVDAFVSPSGAGITDMATTTRMVLGMQQNGFAPAFLGKISPAVGIPRPSLCFNLLVCFVFLFCFRGWGLLAATISVATAISYLMIPICAMSLRRTSPELPRPVRAPVLNLLGSSAFVVAGELLYWARWPLTAQVILLTIVVLPIYGWYRRHSSLDLLKMEFRSAFWLILYLPCIALLSWLGSSEFGGRGFLPYGWDMSVVGVVSYVFSVWGTRSALRNPPTSELLKRD